MRADVDRIADEGDAAVVQEHAAEEERPRGFFGRALGGDERACGAQDRFAWEEEAELDF